MWNSSTVNIFNLLIQPGSHCCTIHSKPFFLPIPAKSKKPKPDNASPQKPEADSGAADEGADVESGADILAKDKKPSEITSSAAPEKKEQQKKYVLFVGNLPYKAKVNHLEKHFKKCECSVLSIFLLLFAHSKLSPHMSYDLDRKAHLSLKFGSCKQSCSR